MTGGRLACLSKICFLNGRALKASALHESEDSDLDYSLPSLSFFLAAIWKFGEMGLVSLRGLLEVGRSSEFLSLKFLCTWRHIGSYVLCDLPFSLLFSSCCCNLNLLSVWKLNGRWTVRLPSQFFSWSYSTLSRKIYVTGVFGLIFLSIGSGGIS